MTEQTVPKPIPMPDEASQPFFDGAREGHLMLMKCGRCAHVRLPSRAHCDNCLSTEVEWVRASGRAVLHTFGVMHQRYHPAFVAEIPYDVSIVELEEGPHMVTNIVDTANEDLRVGMPLEVVFEQHEDVAIPKFRPV